MEEADEFDLSNLVISDQTESSPDSTWSSSMKMGNAVGRAIRVGATTMAANRVESCPKRQPKESINSITPAAVNPIGRMAISISSPPRTRNQQILP
ncbi:hypothetical protein M9H77_36171 [Catharanthus roseus]|uniref:Uncharacterized protein n=1 Tax=Catharanthus roseus TaxID=4058 RepID=A0ACB9ZR10_CATRO|nr:hypothetical protein M9H77_36171 [Catharanthus roseus]